MPKQTKGEKTKSLIEKVAIREFSIHGFQKTSFEMLATASGVKRANIQYHFPKKEDLFLSCLYRVAKENHAHISEKMHLDQSARGKLEIHFYENLNWFLKHPEQAQIVLGFYYLACVDARLTHACHTVLNTGMSRILEYLLLGRRTGEFSFELADAEKIAETLHDALIGGIIRSTTLREFEKPSDDIASTREKWAFLFDSLLR